MTSPVGLIAGRGALPVAIAEGARRAGRSVVCVSVQDADARLAELSEASYTVAPGELGAMIAALRRHDVREVLLAGKVDKLAALRVARLDAEGARAARRMADLRDASILDVLVRALEEAGLQVGEQARYIGDLLPAAGVVGRRPPSPEESEDIRLGLRIAGGMAGLDVGQAVAVHRGVVLAVEAAEGTDAMIRLAGRLAGRCVVVKVSRPDQDPRYDLPVVGPQTIDVLAASGGTALAVEAGRTVLVERGRCVAAADAAGIAVVAVPPQALRSA